MSQIPSNYRTVLYDDFRGSSLNTGNWPVVYGGTANNGAFQYNAGNIHTGSDGLTIETTNSGGGWTTGGFSQGWRGQTYGLYQVHARVDPGQGTGPNIVLWPNDNVWPGPEIDLLEAPNGRGDAFMTLHWAGADGSNQYTTIDTGANVNDWHTYAVDWEPGQLTFYVDGSSIWSTTDHVPDKPMGLGMSGFVAAGSDSWYHGGPDGSTPSSVGLHVDWASISVPTGGGDPAPAPQPTPTPTPDPTPAPGGGPGSGDGGSVPVDSSNTGGGSPSFTSTGDANAPGGLTLWTSPGTDILVGSQAGGNTFFVDAHSPDGWAEIDNMQAGGCAAILGFQSGVSTLAWNWATDPNGVAGATADVSLNGDGHIDSHITFAGTSVDQAETWTRGDWHLDSTPYTALFT